MTHEEALTSIRIAVEQLRRGAYPTAELDWFARDANGDLALLLNAGHLPVPQVVLDHPNGLLALHAAIAELTPRSEMMPDDASSIASKGLYVYDWSGRRVDQADRRYTRVASPPHPVQADTAFATVTAPDLLALYHISIHFSRSSTLEIVP